MIMINKMHYLRVQILLNLKSNPKNFILFYQIWKVFIDKTFIGKYTSLLYKMSKDGASSVTFHKRCDDKGPYLVFINVNGNVNK